MSYWRILGKLGLYSLKYFTSSVSFTILLWLCHCKYFVTEVFDVEYRGGCGDGGDG